MRFGVGPVGGKVCREGIQLSRNSIKFDVLVKSRKPTINVIPAPTGINESRYPEILDGYESTGPRLSPG